VKVDVTDIDDSWRLGRKPRVWPPVHGVGTPYFTVTLPDGREAVFDDEFRPICIRNGQSFSPLRGSEVKIRRFYDPKDKVGAKLKSIAKRSIEGWNAFIQRAYEVAKCI
jgi:hypothetical protein